MVEIKDTDGTEWTVRITAGTIFKVCHALDLSLEDFQNFSKFKVHQLINVLPVLCEKQMNERGVNREDFLDRFALPELKGAFAALKGEFLQSFPQAQTTGGTPGEGVPLGEDPGDSGTSSN